MSKDQSCTAFVCACALVLVTDDLSGQERQDALDALLYSQTAASRKASQFSAAQTWAQITDRAMRVAGASLTDDQEMNFPLPVSGGVTLLEVAQQTMDCWMPAINLPGGQRLSDLKLEATPATLGLLRQHVVRDDKWIRFMFAVVSPGITIPKVVISFEYCGVIGADILQHRFTADDVVGDVCVSASKALLDREDYDFSRATVISLLGERRQEQVLALT
ncbi:hypothetical protein [Pseudomonas sp. H3_G09]